MKAWLDLVPAVAAVALAGRVVYGFAQRWRFPFDLEWMEGGMLAHAWRLTHGLPMYAEPGPEWIAYVYPPGYAALLAALSPVFGLDYPLGRGISIAGTLAAAALLAWLVGRRGQWGLGVVVAGVFLGCWRASGGFYDLVRPDGLAMALLAGVFVAARERGPRWPFVAGALLFVAFLVKHHSAAFGVPLALYLLLRGGVRPALAFGLTAAVPAGLFTVGAELATGGRFLDYLLAIPASHPVDWRRVFPGVPGELGTWLAPALVTCSAWLVATMPALRAGVPRLAVFGLPALGALAAAAAIASNPQVRGVAMPPFVVHLVAGAAIGAAAGAGVSNGVATGLSPAGWRGFGANEHSVRWWGAFGVAATCYVVVTAMRGHNGGFMNVLMPAHFCALAGMGLVFDLVRRSLPDWRVSAATAAAALLQVLFVWERLAVDDVLPTDADRTAGATVLDRLRTCPPGPILSLYAPWLPAQVGREPSPHLIALWDIDHSDGPFHDGVARFRAAAREQHWRCVVSAGRQKAGYGLEEAYMPDTSFTFPNGEALLAKTGWKVRVGTVLVPREAP